LKTAFIGNLMISNLHKKFISGLTVLLLLGCDNKNENDLALLSSYPKRGACSIDGPERNSTVDNSKDLLIRGWAYDGQSQQIPQTLTLYMINEHTKELTLATLRRGEKRGDVAKAFGNPALEESGFSGILSKDKLKTGNYHLILLQMDRNIGAIACAGEPHKIVIN